MPTVTVMRKIKIEFNAIRIEAEPRYPEEDCPGIPFLDGDLWKVTIDLLPDGTAKIRDWPGPEFDLHTKVCDCFSFYLLDGGKTVLSREGDYVPDFMPGNHYGDYVILKIAADGTITNWEKDPDYESAFSRD